MSHPVPLPRLSVHGALTLGSNLIAAAEPIEERPAFLASSLLRLDESVRELRGAVQYRSQLQISRPTRQQRARAEVEVHCALDGVKAGVRSYALRVAVMVDDCAPETVSLARTLIAPLVEWERRDAQLLRIAPPLRLSKPLPAGGDVPQPARARRPFAVAA